MAVLTCWRRTNTSDDVAYSETSVEHNISDSRRRGGLLQVIGRPMNSPTKLAALVCFVMS